MRIKVVKDGECIHELDTDPKGRSRNPVYALLAFLAVISPDERDAVILMMLDSASSDRADLAKAMGVSPSTISRRCVSARALLTRIIESGTVEARGDLLVVKSDEEVEKSEAWKEFFSGDIRKLPSIWGMAPKEERRRTRI